jgi:hypothetical protein
MGLSFTNSAGPRQRCHSQVRVPRDSGPYFTVSDSRLPQPGGPSPRIYISQEQGDPVISSRHWVPFSSPPTTRRATVEVFGPVATRRLPKNSLNSSANWPCLQHFGTDRVENVTSILLYSLIAVETCLFAEPLLSNGCCTVACFAVIA